ncbi:DUF2441 domain-containing protein [Achromobacter xylosoxidans]|uniref:DUF2441 domain-containing protein n=1 Tax=Alcaligenes xylosoxydans xylosoxydans TaxID=85698 RepID=UPI001EEE071A|nr:DUF2441 domain-containing protein [Achromobacter xylosoxidans]
MEFIHAIDLWNWFPCHNLALSGRLMSPNALAALDSGGGEVHQFIDDVPIEDLAAGLHPPSAVTPRAAGEIVRAGILRQGMELANGFNEVELMSDKTKQDALRSSDVELVFERVRREVMPSAVSRLSCLYLAERSEEGEAMLRTMLGRNVYILRVRPMLTLRITKVDAAWFDGFFDSNDIGDARQYWRGIERMPGNGKWEYLFDGVLEVEDPAQIEYVRTHGASMASAARRPA